MPPAFQNRLLKIALQSGGAVLWLAGALSAELLRFDAANEWRTWPLPLGIVALDDAGRLVWARAEEGRAGGRAWVWDGRGRWGAPVGPGLYIAELRVEGDEKSYSRRRVVAVAY